MSLPQGKENLAEIPQTGSATADGLPSAAAETSGLAPSPASAAAVLGEIGPMAYVQEGLVLHYDGIRNAGVDMPHDSSATIWKDLSETGNDAEFIGNGNKSGGWVAKGYHFASNGVFQTKRVQDIGTSFTVQIAADARNYAHKGTAKPQFFGCHTTWWSMYLWSKDTVHLNADTISGLNWQTRANFAGWSGRYLTAITDGRDTALFEGVTPLNYAMGNADSAKKDSLGSQIWAVGGLPTNGLTSAIRAERMMTMPVFSVRVYNRVLTDAEMARNRVVDEARFFGNILATNMVVVSASISGVEGNERSGVYMPSGWTFSAGPGVVDLDGRGYMPTGYTVEKWDADKGVWIQDEQSDTSAEWTSPSGDGWPSRRITWKWKIVRGVRSMNAYNAGDYVQDGLVLHYDGISNSGVDNPHDYSAVVWKDLSRSGSDAEFAGDGAGGGWIDDGYDFSGSGVFLVNGKLDFGNAFTVQIVASNGGYSHVRDTWPWFFGCHTTWWSVYLNANDSVRLRLDQKMSGLGRPTYSDVSGWPGRYLTAFCEGRNIALFDGTTPSAYVMGGDSGRDSLGAQSWAVGGPPADELDDAYRTPRLLKTPLNAIRVYSRILTDEELAYNRTVDMARFDGVMSITNVVVAPGKYEWCASGMSEKPGEYAVEGTWTFTAFDTKDNQGKTRKIAGWEARAWDDAACAWGAPQKGKGGSYTYTVGESPAKIRLEWLWVPAPFMMVVR